MMWAEEVEEISYLRMEVKSDKEMELIVGFREWDLEG